MIAFVYHQIHQSKNTKGYISLSMFNIQVNQKQSENKQNFEHLSDARSVSNSCVFYVM